MANIDNLKCLELAAILFADILYYQGVCMPYTVGLFLYFCAPQLCNFPVGILAKLAKFVNFYYNQSIAEFSNQKACINFRMGPIFVQ